jgi:hypothetical protein
MRKINGPPRAVAEIDGVEVRGEGGGVIVIMVGGSRIGAESTPATGGTTTGGTG